MGDSMKEWRCAASMKEALIGKKKQVAALARHLHLVVGSASWGLRAVEALDVIVEDGEVRVEFGDL